MFLLKQNAKLVCECFLFLEVKGSLKMQCQLKNWSPVTSSECRKPSETETRESVCERERARERLIKTLSSVPTTIEREGVRARARVNRW